MPALRRLPACLFIAAYLLLTAWYLARHVVGDPGEFPLRYFFTWDMYPAYDTEIARPLVVGFDAEGRAWQLVPGPLDQFRWGNHNDAARTDLDRRSVLLRRIVAAEVRRLADAPKSVTVFEHYRPLILSPNPVVQRDADESRSENGERPEPTDPAATATASVPTAADANEPVSWRGRNTYWRTTARATVNERGDLQWAP